MGTIALEQIQEKRISIIEKDFLRFTFKDDKLIENFCICTHKRALPVCHFNRRRAEVLLKKKHWNLHWKEKEGKKEVKKNWVPLCRSIP